MCITHKRQLITFDMIKRKKEKLKTGSLLSYHLKSNQNLLQMLLIQNDQ